MNGVKLTYHNKVILGLSLTLIFGTCGPGSLKPSDWKNWVCSRETGTVGILETKEYNLEALYKPSELIAVNELAKNQINQLELDDLVKKYKGSMYVDLKVFSKEKESIAEIIRLIQKSSKLLIDNKEVEPSLVHHEATLGVTPFENILFIFPVEVDLSATYKLLVPKFYSDGFYQIEIPVYRLKSAPKLKLID